jgi:ribonucleoside-diphosphate reductase alpha chain
MSEIYWLNKDSRLFLERGYLKQGVTPEQRIKEIAKTAESILKINGFAEKFELYLNRGWYSLSSPIWSNFGAERGLSISCNGSYIPDDTGDILSKNAEVGMMTKHGAGTSAYFGDIRPRGSPIAGGGKTDGAVSFMREFDLTTSIISQSNVRRGSFAAYLPIEHGDIEEFLQIKSEKSDIQDMSFGVTITDKWMKEMIGGDNNKRELWGKVIRKRFESGYPYIIFSDTVNNNKPQVYKDKNMKIYASNLCSEICLPASVDESFVCDLSSLNVLHYEEWKDTDAVEVLTYFLDAVMTDYIEKVKNIKHMTAAYNFAVNHRALGVGVLGWHSLLQSKMIAFESIEAKFLNTEIHRLIRDKTLKASKEMAKKFGEPPVLKGYGLRNTTLMAIAPTTSSSFILGQVSPSIEPLPDNYHVKDLAKGTFTYKNPYLKKLLHSKDKDSADVWKDILAHGGSVQHLDFLSKIEKDVFKTFDEISPKEILIQAASRQKFIDQSQSLNLRINKSTSPKDMNKLLIFAWENGIKSLYYQRGTNAAQQLVRDINSCSSCEG